MNDKQDETYYVYCHTCKDLIFEGNVDKAVQKSCLKTHTYTCGKKEYYEKVYPEVKLEAKNKDKEITEQMEFIIIPPEVKDKEFFFTGSYFVAITGLNEKNKIAHFDNKITDMARTYADIHTPEIHVPLHDGYGGDSDKGKYINKYRTEYWTSIFNIGIWNYLEKNNTVTLFLSPELKK